MIRWFAVLALLVASVAMAIPHGSLRHGSVVEGLPPGAGGNLGPYRSWGINDPSINNNLCVQMQPSASHGQTGCTNVATIALVAEDITITRIVAGIGPTDRTTARCNVTLQNGGVNVAGTTFDVGFGNSALDESGEFEDRNGLSIPIAAGTDLQFHMITGDDPCATGGGSIVLDVYAK
jgi:hypothetical protein